MFHTGVTAINPATTHHINHTADHPCTEVLHTITPEIKADPIHANSTNPPGEIHTDHTCTLVDHEVNHITGGTPE